MYETVQAQLAAELDAIREAGLFKQERALESTQAAEVVAGGKDVLDFCANNYLGLADHPRIRATAKAA